MSGMNFSQIPQSDQQGKPPEKAQVSRDLILKTLNKNMLPSQENEPSLPQTLGANG